MGWIVIEVSARTFHVPMECACCGGTPETQRSTSHTRTSGKRVIRETTRGLAFPYCHKCIGHIDIWESAGGAAMLVLVLGIIASFFAGFGINGVVGLGTFGASCVLASIVSAKVKKRERAACHSQCASAEAAVAYLGWSGTINAFRFSSPQYANKFGNGNAKKLINVSPALAQFLQQSTTPPSPKAPSPTRATPPSARASVTEWIDRIEGYKGSVARRNALEKALEEIRDPAERDQLLIAASKIEVRAVLDKIDTLKSVAAKRRHLQQAIEQIRLDNIPDELQAAELRILEQRVHTLS